MKLVTYTFEGKTSVGKVVGDKVVDLSKAYEDVPATVLGILQGGKEVMSRLEAVRPEDATTIPLSEVKLEAPIQNPQKYLAIGLNYKDHVEEILKRGGKGPEHQMWFNKNVSCINGPYDPINLPKVSEALDYEGELGVVIGKRCKNVPESEALDAVGGYLVIDDVTCRDWQRKTTQWTLGKSFDTHGPIGPWLITPDEVPDPHALEMRLFVNGELRQKTSTGGMVYDIPAQISYLSTVMTLEPGDIIATGTCSGAGFGFTPPRFLKVGDFVRVEIDGIGHIENEVVAEP
ncbi:fumarylacetoacetate hydrolase family protein [Paraburkholderia rhynchosiae]|uniref:5-carboxymethyl-2-hydroxymuconate isomerase n=1 Tax=Paraburkholderia rhynchosiae TaxID=487049 RepID=A0A2N7WWM5_9BURK|nr:fumarylacetoacetate hydrolase family protein [Paraburkholderia rhynchosiae]PMS33780.1 5-carboxymethyl-2-hydroxymuconate isomerase [Paraburkholderia rhynchosiae]CAB3668961.1 Ureidoglycolate lyase [Paraburkholderia rhynchosiae]